MLSALQDEAALIAKVTAVKDLCDQYESVYYPNKTPESPLLTDAQVRGIFDLAEPFKQFPKVMKTIRCPPFFKGPPGWVNDEHFMRKMRAMMGGRAFDFVTENLFVQRKLDTAHRFYTFHYQNLDAYNLRDDKKFKFEELETRNLNKVTTSCESEAIPYSQHLDIHLRAGCKVDLLSQTLCQDPDELLTTVQFKAK
eukprot:gene36094-44512_t